MIRKKQKKMYHNLEDLIHTMQHSLLIFSEGV